MALDDLKHHLSELDEHMHGYIDDSLEYIQLKGFKYSMVLVAFMVKMFVLSIFLLLALLILSIYGAFILSDMLNNPHVGFLIVGMAYVVLGILIYVFRHRLDKPILRLFSTYYFDET